jgi:hypothetical protein
LFTSFGVFHPSAGGRCCSSNESRRHSAGEADGKLPPNTEQDSYGPQLSFKLFFLHVSRRRTSSGEMAYR